MGVVVALKSLGLSQVVGIEATLSEWAWIDAAIGYLADQLPNQAYAIGLLIVASAMVLHPLWALIRWRARMAKRARKRATLRRLNAMDWREFEEWLAVLFAGAGYSTELFGGSGGGDGGIDLMLRKNGQTLVVQAKRYRGNVGAPVIREMVGVQTHLGADGIIVATTAGFTKEAKAFALGKPITLLDGAALVAMAKRR